MLINANTLPATYAAKSKPAVAATSAESAPAAPAETFQRSSETTTPLAVKVGKWALAAGATGGVGALGYYAGSQFGAGAAIAGAVVGGLAGALGLGAVGTFADIGGGILGSSNKALPMAITGGVVGAIAGGVAAAYTAGPITGTILAAAGGLSAFAVTAAATNILHK